MNIPNDIEGWNGTGVVAGTMKCTKCGTERFTSLRYHHHDLVECGRLPHSISWPWCCNEHMVFADDWKIQSQPTVDRRKDDTGASRIGDRKILISAKVDIPPAYELAEAFKRPVTPDDAIILLDRFPVKVICRNKDDKEYLGVEAYILREIWQWPYCFSDEVVAIAADVIGGRAYWTLYSDVPVYNGNEWHGNAVLVRMNESSMCKIFKLPHGLPKFDTPIHSIRIRPSNPSMF